MPTATPNVPPSSTRSIELAALQIAARSYCAQHHQACCAELVEWSASGALRDGHVRHLATLFAFTGEQSLKVAEEEVKAQAVARLAPVDEHASSTAFEQSPLYVTSPGARTYNDQTQWAWEGWQRGAAWQASQLSELPAAPSKARMKPSRLHVAANQALDEHLRRTAQRQGD